MTTDIKPDTSLYTDLPSRFRALALIVEGWAKGEPVQIRVTKDGEWEPTTCPQWLRDPDYRLAPKPRELWALFDEHGGQCGSSADEVIIRSIAKAKKLSVARFVEVME